MSTGKMNFLSQIKQTYAFEPYLNIGNDHHCKAIRNRSREMEKTNMQKIILMYNFIKEKVAIDMRKEHEQFNNLRSLFTTGELSASNSFGKYIYECFHERQCT